MQAASRVRLVSLLGQFESLTNVLSPDLEALFLIAREIARGRGVDLSYTSVLLAMTMAPGRLCSSFAEYSRSMSLAEVMRQGKFTPEDVERGRKSEASYESVSLSVGSNLSAVLSRAQQIANEVSPEMPFDVRHLMAAYIVDIEPPGRLEQFGLPQRSWANWFASQMQAAHPHEMPHWLRLLPNDAKADASPKPAPAPVLSVSESKLQFSPKAARVLERAREIAGDSRRSTITSSCLLFALADTLPYFSSMLDAGGGAETLDSGLGLDEVRKAFLNDAPSIEVPEGHGHFSNNMASILGKARELAERVSSGSEVIHARHLLGGLFLAPEGTGAVKRLITAGFGMSELSRKFLDVLPSHAPSDDIEKWSAIFKVSHFVSGTAGYTSEFCGIGRTGSVEDYLGVDALAKTLAELIVHRETKLPLAIGLFGNWGSGKSHFMNLMDRHMKKVSNSGENRWCRKVVPIYFNAWHYSDSNLWASLVCEVFDKLRASIDAPEPELRLLENRLKQAGGVTSLALEESRQASAAIEHAKQALSKAQEESKSARKVFGTFLRGLATLIPQLDTIRNEERTIEYLGVRAEYATLAELAEKRREMASFWQQLQEYWRAPGLARRIGWLAGVLLASFFLRYAAMNEASLKHAVDQVKPLLQGVIVLAATVGAWVLNAYAGLKKGLHQFQQAQAGMPSDLSLVQARENLSQAEACAAAAQTALAAAQSAEATLLRAVEEAGPEKQLNRFIADRARSSDYRAQLGLVSLARRDFEELSGIFADSEALAEKLDKIKDEPEAKERLKTLSTRVDRVVLFIDDLDRCAAEKVIDVLQAVHLLLAYPLFAVIVGVDQRYLRQSLRIRFKALLTPDDGTRHGAHPNADVEENPATPLDYLEKIFHIPFHLPPMTPEGFETLIKNLTEPVPDAAAEDLEKAPVSAAVAEVPQPIASPDTPPRKSAAAIQTVAQAAVPVARSASAQASRTVGVIPLTDWERNALKDHHPLIGSPRAATRLLNTYRLLRAGIAASDWDTFRGDEGGQREFRLPMLFLAAAAGSPALTRTWFRELRQTAPSLPSDTAMPGSERYEWQVFCKLYREAVSGLKIQLTAEMSRKWLDRTERFTF